MYEKHFQLRERPFALSPDPDYLYPSRVHQEALGYLRYGIEGHAGFVVITGEIGSGKTTMLQSLLGRLDRNTTVARLVNTMLDPRELLDAIMLDFGIDPTGLSKPVLLHKLADFLVQQRQAGRLTLLVIDEAQNLSLPALEEIRMLSNLETEKSKLIQIIMTGQPELREKLQLPQLEQLRQRITVSYHLQPLDAEETANYINHRLKRAAIGAPMEFPRDVMALIHRRSGGVPRIINVIADATLLFAYGIDRRDVDLNIADDAIAELDATGVLASYQSEGLRAAAHSAVSVAETEEALRFADEVRRREQALVDRERQLAAREQAITMQQRVVEEEARLLATARAVRPATVSRRPPFVERRIAPPTVAGAPVAPVAPVAPIASPSMETFEPANAGLAATSSPIGSAGATALRTDMRQPIVPTSAEVRHRRSPAPPTFAPTTTSTGLRVQRYKQPPPVRGGGLWDRVRRVLFGVTEPQGEA